ncbi:hypothetical protein WDW89_11490 [Deltaproteobacteria bacterium TL4]
MFQLKYRIITDGQRYRIQRKGGVLFFIWIVCFKFQYYLLRGIVIREPIEFDSMRKAKKWIEGEFNRQTDSKTWRLAEGQESYSWKPIPVTSRARLDRPQQLKVTPKTDKFSIKKEQQSASDSKPSAQPDAPPAPKFLSPIQELRRASITQTKLLTFTERKLLR